LSIYFINQILVDLKSTLGWDSTFGLSLWARVYSNLVPNDFYQGVGADISFETDSVYFELFARTNKEISDGIFIEPWFEYYLGKFTFYAYCDFEGVAAEGGGAVTISPALGIKFSF